MEDYLNVINWFIEKIQQQRIIYHEDLVENILNLFGSKFVYINEFGTYSINVKLLRELRKRIPNLHWDSKDKSWELI